MNRWAIYLKEGAIMGVCCAVAYYFISGESVLRAATFGLLMGLFWGFCFSPYSKRIRDKKDASRER